MQLVSEILVQETFEKNRDYLAWSVGCASGEEPYSLAMLLDAYKSDAAREYRFRVTGTDISLPSLRRAREGIYLGWRLRDVPVTYREQYCRVLSDRYFRITEELRSRVCFSRLNLRDLKNTSMPKFNLIFCQNLLIYYARRRRLEIVSDLAECLRPGGVLILGVGELLDWHNSNMEKVRYPDTLAYRRMN
jgi:chemotaxis protein methyltransferase CheR/type IV pilus assembly protein PilK